jgi:hypothetical protein
MGLLISSITHRIKKSLYLIQCKLCRISSPWLIAICDNNCEVCGNCIKIKGKLENYENCLIKDCPGKNLDFKPNNQNDNRNNLINNEMNMNNK